MSNFSVHTTKDELAQAVAKAIAVCLRDAVETRGEASLVASGGGTPKAAFALLSKDQTIPWDKVTVTLSDERMAPDEAGVSNAQMLREHLFKDAASAATFLPLESLSSLENANRPFDVILLGIGGDGHYASIFPDGVGMAAAVADDAPVLCETTPSPLPPEAPFSRLTLSLASIRESRHLFLMIAGEGKKQVVDLAASDDPQGDLPIRKLLKDPDISLSIFWAP